MEGAEDGGREGHSNSTADGGGGGSSDMHAEVEPTSRSPAPNATDATAAAADTGALSLYDCGLLTSLAGFVGLIMSYGSIAVEGGQQRRIGMEAIEK